MSRAYNDGRGNGAEAEAEVIIRVRVDEKGWLGVLPAVFGRRALELEMAVYGWMDRLCAEYTGGYWEFYRLSDGGFYMAPDCGRFRVVCSGNGFEGELSADGAGLVACLYALNGLACKYSREQAIEGYYWLKDYAFEHEEAGVVLRAID